jgi:2-polyprenyl-6-methoxyphenol hydroxylase-like FAD-dependent oxidoreductase
VKSAIVLGGSVAGLLAAHVLAGHAERVSVIEPDSLDAAPGARLGAPQGGHPHTLLGRGQEVVEGFLPGFCAQLVGEGALLFDVATDAGWFLDGHQRVSIPGEPLLSMTRPFLEDRLRRRVLAHPRISVVRGRAVGLTVTGQRVDGALVAPGAGGSGERLAADLVVDASGRSSRLGDWLRRIGYEPPPKQRVAVDIGYATCFFHRPPGQRLGDVIVAHSVRSSRTGRPGAASLNAVEGDRWMALTTGYQSDRPGRDLPDFLARCRADPAPPMRLVARECEPVSEVATYRFPDSVRRDFHRLRTFPAGLVAVGDSVASFNPIYGQGMSAAALHAEALSAWLGSGGRPDAPAHRYFRLVARVVDAAWTTSAAKDRFLPHVRTGPLDRRDRFRLRLGGMVAYASLVDAGVARLFADVLNMRRHPRRMRYPDVLLRAVRADRGRRRGLGAATPADPQAAGAQSTRR